MRSSTLLLLWLLAGCAGLSVERRDDRQEVVPANYRALAAQSLKASFKDPSQLADLEISEPRADNPVGGPAALVCVKFTNQATSYFYTLLFRDGRVATVRYAVATDRCPEQRYAPFDIAAPN